MTKELKKLPTYDELVNMEIINSKENDFQVLVNQNPPAAWVQTNKLANNSLYLPIDKVEYLLTRLFIKWHVEVLDFKIIANSVGVHIRLFYTSPITGELLHTDGLGAAPLQTDKDKGAIDFNFIKNAAVQMALPAAESYAIKDAAEKIGRIFGKDLNRKYLMNYESLNNRFETKLSDKDLEPIIESLEAIFDLDGLEMYWNQLTKDLQKDKGIVKLFETKSSELNAKK